MPTKPAPLLQPFAGVLPSPDKAHLVATRSYLTYSDYELKDKLSRNPYSYLHVIHPDGMLDSGMGRIREAFRAFLERGWLMPDAASHYYVLRQSGPLGTCTGVIGLVPTAAAVQGRIKVHESTLAKRENLFAQYLSSVGLNAEPALLAHPENAALDAVLESVTQEAAPFDFTTADGVRHTLWRTNAAQRQTLASAYGEMEAAYIADGHHRVASSMRMAAAHPEHRDAHAFMALLVPGKQLIFRGYHRILRSKNGGDDFTRALDRLHDIPGAQWRPGADGLNPQAGHIVLRGRQKGTLHIAEALASSGLSEAEWLQQHVLEPLFDIHDPRLDPRLDYLPGDLDAPALEQATAGDDRLAFIMPAMTFQGLQAVADAGRFMPPKSTWIAPKLRSGLTLFDFGPAS